jgi:hypothetical protein
MRNPLAWGLLALAVAATGVAIWAGNNFTVALPSAAIAVVAASLLFVDVEVRRPARTARPFARAMSAQPNQIRAAFLSGQLGREKLVGILDRLERSGPDPSLPPRRYEELQSIVAMSREQFQQYLVARLEYLEART